MSVVSRIKVGQDSCFGRNYGGEYGNPYKNLCDAGFDCIDMGISDGPESELVKKAESWRKDIEGHNLEPVCYHSIFLKPWRQVKENVDLQKPHMKCAQMLIQRLGRRLEHLHLNDNDGIADQHLPVLSQMGTIDWKEVFKALKAAGYDGVLNEELPPMTGVAWTAWSIFERTAEPLRALWIDV